VQVATAETSERIHALAVTADGRFVVTGGEKCSLVVRHMHNLKVHRRMETMASPITALAVTEEHCFVVGLQDGTLLLWSPAFT
jgi:hypothetical protein